MTVCTRCNRVLKDPFSIAVKMGPVCRKKTDAGEDDQRNEDWVRPVNLVTLTKPFAGDIHISRDEDGNCVTNVPHTCVEHSPDGFEFGYGGSGPSDLALNILNAYYPPDLGDFRLKCYKGHASSVAGAFHQEFKWKFIAPLDQQRGGSITEKEIREWVEEQRAKTQ